MLGTEQTGEVLGQGGVFKAKFPRSQAEGPIHGQELPSHTSLFSPGSTHPSQKCLEPPISEGRRGFWDVTCPTSVIL